uniref:Uncharacterized protein n=1 Tax=Cacopsylla melanoneura TaxID=428564 RepID=A0A8D8R8C3_9HEMI
MKCQVWNCSEQHSIEIKSVAWSSTLGIGHDTRRRRSVEITFCCCKFRQTVFIKTVQKFILRVVDAYIHKLRDIIEEGKNDRFRKVCQKREEPIRTSYHS